MQPSLAQGDIVLSYKKSEIEQSDIIAFYYNNKILIKRVIAGPGDTVDIDGQGNVYVNGELLEEEYLAKKDFGNSDQTYPLQVADNSWFVLGDERSTSMDSRMSAIGTISEEQIIGKIVLRIWPLGAVGTVK
jgi:signal peptidase I